MALTKITTDSIDLSSDTTGLKIPKGTTAERPAGTTGMIRENTDTGNVEVYNGSAWRALQQTGQDTGIVPTNNFNTVIYSTATSPHAITGLNFQPDFTWVKSRTYGYPNILADSVRGLGNDKMLISNFDGEEGSTDATDANAQVYGYISSLDLTGFTGTAGTSGNGSFVGASGVGDYVSWSWKAGGVPTATNVATTGAMTANSVSLNGALQAAYTPSGSPDLYPEKMSINTEAGFSIINYDGTGSGPDTISHGLTSAPEFVIIKSMSNVEGWLAWPKYGTTSYTYELSLNSDAAEYNSAGNMFAGDTTDTLISLGTDGWVNGSQEYICYAWHSVPGYSLIGSYTGTSSTTNVPKIYTGFLPAWIMVKRTDYAGDWNIVDDKRSTSNTRALELFANTNGVEATANYVNFNDDGFQIQTTDADWNAQNGEYIFMCFAS